MNEPDLSVFDQLFRDAVLKCFGHPLIIALSETECKLLYNKIFEETGLVIGWKSLKNYSIAVLDHAKPENPSVATLDTLARYVAGAPYTDETSRKDKESHFPYWFDYKNRAVTLRLPDKTAPPRRIQYGIPLFVVTALLVLLTLFLYMFRTPGLKNYQIDFSQPIESGEAGWHLNDPDNAFWARRNQSPGYLTLFTLRGDNWPDTTAPNAYIRNLLFRRMDAACFGVEVQLNEFVPRARWQQAGILLMEDTTMQAKSIRLSLGYNDFFGGYSRSPEFIIQAISSSGQQSGKPEEIVHQTLLAMDSLQKNPALLRNFHYSSLRIEKKGNEFRFLYAGGEAANGAFHELSRHTVDINPKYVALFALKGFVTDTVIIPVQFKSFSLMSNECPK